MKKTLVLFSILALMTGTGLAQEGLNLNAIGGGLSFIKPENVSGTIGFAAHADLGEVIENLVVFPSLTYWSKGAFSEFGINADGRYYFPSEGDMAFFAGGGLGLLFGSVDIGNNTSVSDTDIGLNLFGGLDKPIGKKLDFTAEARIVFSGGTLFRIHAGLIYALGE